MAGPVAIAASPPHDHALHRGAALTGAARQALEASGEQWTPMRADMFDTLAAFEKPASAYDIADRLSARRGRRVAANSAYRILDLFVATNLVHRIESANAYVVNPHPGCRHDCIFLVCSACGTVLHLDDDGVTAGVRSVAEGLGFATERPVIEVRGRCAACGPETKRNGSTGQPV